MLDKLRVCIICNFYSQNGRLAHPEYMNHPAIKSLKCEHLEMAIGHARSLVDTSNTSNQGITGTLEYRVENDFSTNESSNFESKLDNQSSNSNYIQQYDVKICIGNVSKFVNETSSNSEPPTYKWMVYIRSPQCNRLESYIKKVIFFLHSSYKPNDIVEIK